jgi:AcrR family transcriptional regulator
VAEARALTRPSRLTAERRREQILDVTTRIVGEHGVHAVSIDRVAREAGISRPIVYEHFSNLSGLLHALLARETNRAGAQLAEVLVRLTPGGQDPTELLLEALAGYLDMVRADPITWRLILTPPEGAPKQPRARIEQAREATIAQLGRAARQRLCAGRRADHA